MQFSLIICRRVLVPLQFVYQSMIPLWLSSSNNGVVNIIKAAAEAPNDGRQLAGINHVIKFIQSSARLSPAAPGCRNPRLCYGVFKG